MQPSNTICVSQEGPANALALNKDCTQVVIAGRNVFKVFSIGENEFTEVCNLRVGKNLNLNFSSIDVAWSAIEENTLATAATNGAVVVWNLGRSGRSKQEHVFSDHKRTVNKVSFHLTEPSLLISGSQDGMMKCFDLRMKEVARTFISNTESIRDVQFSPHQAHTFAAVSENGGVQLWDVRRHERCLAQFTAHSGPVFACDWHPAAAAPRLATASRDKTIKVWDLHAKPTLEHTIHTIASVGHVKWRPQKKYQVASCALVLDCAVHVWDVRRPHVPLATFAEHRDVTTAIAWQGEPNAFLSTSRDCSLYRHQWSEAAHPVLWANPWGVCVSARGDVAHAAPERPLPALPTNASAHTRHTPQPHLPTLPRKQPTAGSLSAAAQAILERAFPAGAASVLTRYKALDPHGPILACAKRYRIRGAPTHELAEHNAKVARENNRHMVAHVWEVVRTAYSGCASARPPPLAPPPPAPPPPRHPPPPPLPPFAVEEESIDEEIEEWAEGQFQYSGVLGLPTHTIYIPPAKYGKGRTPHDEEEPGWVSAASAHYVDVEAIDWSLPEEAFPLRAAGAAPLPPHAALPAHAPHPPHPAHPAHPADCPADEKDELADKFDKIHGHPGNGSGTCSSPSSSSSGSGSMCTCGASASAPVHGGAGAGAVGGGMAEEGSLSVRGGCGRGRAAPLNTAPPLAAALRLHAELGDVQTAACVLLALLEHRNDLFPYIDESLQEQWLLGYIELLQRHKLYNEATMVIKCAWVGSVWALSQQSTTIAVCCARCGRRTRAHGGAACDHCRQVAIVCAVCRQIVRGLYAWCQGCSHGGHLAHMQAWLARHSLCPAGCGHHCTLTG